jgi:diaphanous 2
LTPLDVSCFTEENENGTSTGGKKVKGLRVLDPKSAQNLSILLGGSLKHMSFDTVKVAILKCDETVLSGNLLEQLINYLPPADQLKKLEELQSEYDDLSGAEQFCVTVSFQ